MRLTHHKDATKSRLEGLHNLSLFSHCSQKQLEYVDSRTDQVAVPAGEVLIHEGRLNHTFFLLLDGGVEITRAGKPVATLGPGDFFGEISMVDRGLATATVTTLTNGRLFVMSHMQFRDAIKASEPLMVKVLMAMGERLREDAQARG